MACGTPVIGANVGGIKYTIDHGMTGYLVPPKRPDVLALQLDYLYRNPEKIAQLAQEGLRRVLNYFTWKQVADLVSAVYGNIVEGEADAELTRPAGRQAPRLAALSAPPGNGEQPAAERRSNVLQLPSRRRKIKTARAIFINQDDLIAEAYQQTNGNGLPIPADNSALGLCMLQAYGFRLFIISNQPDIAHGSIEEQAFAAVITRTTFILSQADIELAGFYYCPHHPNATLSSYAVNCECRKPKPALLFRAAREHCLELSESWMLGKILDDVEAGKRAGCRAILLTLQRESSWEYLRPLRTPDYLASSIDRAAHIIVELETQQLEASTHAYARN
jgi:D-glycero-D-manno-heptose 1,7-bisphosphate phosphatase